MERCVDIIVLDNKDRCLLLKRNSDDNLFPDKWCFPGGHINDGEKMQDAAKRELEEETGIIATGLIKIGSYEYDNDFCSTLFLADEQRGSINSNQIQLAIKEHQAAKWIPFNDILDEDLAGDLKDCIKALILDEWPEDK